MTAETQSKHLKVNFLGFHAVVLVKTEDLSIDVSITNVGLILTKLRWFHYMVFLLSAPFLTTVLLFSEISALVSPNSISTFFEKQIKFLGFHAVVLVKTFPLMYQLLM